MTDTEPTAAQSDADAITLGNLATVEFDLDLPATGRNGSRIVWRSSDDRWLDGLGHVHRPTFGRGNRKVTLTATVTNGNAIATREFHATIVQRPCTAAIRAVLPVMRRIAASPDCVGPLHVRLPSWGAAVTDDDAIAVPLSWPEPEVVIERPRTQRHPRRIVVDGHAGTEPPFPVKAVIDVVPDAGQATAPAEPTLRGIPLDAIRFDERSVIGRDQRLRLEYLRSLDDDRLLYAFRAAAGLDVRGATPMTGWDSPDCLLRGHTTGHVLSAYALCARSTGDETIRGKLRDLVHGLAEVQHAFMRRDDCHPGFLSAYDERQFDDLERLTPYPDVWAPYYTLHKILAGLLDAHDAGVAEALPVAEGIGRWVVDRLGRLDPQHRQRMWAMYIAGEFGGMNEAMARLAAATDDHHAAERLIAAARWFDNDRLLEPLRQHVDALDGMHANQHIPQAIGHLAIHAGTGIDDYRRAAEHFWHEAVESHCHAFGGVGQGEMFHAPNVIAALLDDDTAETCATYNLVRLANGLRMFADRDGISPAPEYGDYIELALRNHIAASIDRSAPNGGSTYFLPTRPSGRKTFDVDGNTCCHGTGLEVHFRAGEGALLLDDDTHTGTDTGTLHIQLLSGMHADSPDDGIRLDVMSSDDAPQLVRVRIMRLPCRELRVRVPWWARGRRPEASIDGRPCDDDDIGYDASTHELVFDAGETPGHWATGTVITIRFPIGMRIVRTPDDADVASFTWGPYVLAALADDDGTTHDTAMPDVAVNPNDVAAAFARTSPSDGPGHFGHSDEFDHPDDPGDGLPVAFTHRATGLRFVPVSQIPADVPYHLYCHICIATSMDDPAIADRI